MGTITLDKMVSVAFGSGGLKTSVEGKWDEFWFVGLFFLQLCLWDIGSRELMRDCASWRWW